MTSAVDSATFDDTVLQSTWIRRLKAKDINEEFAIESGSNFCEEIPCRINLSAAAKEQTQVRNGFGAFQLKPRKPPLPPSSKQSKLDTRRLKVHALDMKMEQLHRQGSRKDLLVELASRLDIKAKPTPVGTYRLANRKKSYHDYTLTPVACPRNSSLVHIPKKHGRSPLVRLKKEDNCSTGSDGEGVCLEKDGKFTSTSESLLPEACLRNSTATESLTLDILSNLKRNSSLETTSRTIESSACCGSSPFPGASDTSLRKFSRLRRVTRDSSQPEGCSRTGEETKLGKRTSEPSVNLHGEHTVIKRSRLSGEGIRNAEPFLPGKDAALTGPWLNRWAIRNTPPTWTVQNVWTENKNVQARFVQIKGQRATVEAPSAAAMAIVGAAIRQLQNYSPKPLRILQPGQQ